MLDVTPTPADAPLEPVQPIRVAVIGTGTGSGGPTQIIAQTPGRLPNIIVQVIPPARAIAIRFVYAFLTALLGVEGLTATGVAHAETFEQKAILALGMAVASFGKDLLTIFGKLEEKYPLLSGGI